MEEKIIKLSVLNDLLKNKNKYFVKEEKGYQGVPSNNYDGIQGEYNETFKYYRHPEFPENLFMREVWHTNSYGDYDMIVKIEFVEGKKRQITVYEFMQ